MTRQLPELPDLRNRDSLLHVESRLMPDIAVVGARVAAASRGLVRLPVGRDLTGPVEIAVHVAAGAGDGPTVLLLSMLHGNEWFSALVVREVMRRIDPAALRGAVLGVPVANPPAMLTNTRCVQDNSDEPDANRTFGGPYQWLTNQISRAIAEELIACSDAIIDYHVGDWGATMADVSYVTDYTRPGVSAASRAMALAYGFPVLHALTIHTGLRGPRTSPDGVKADSGLPVGLHAVSPAGGGQAMLPQRGDAGTGQRYVPVRSGTSLGYAGERFGIPGIVAEVGGLGFGLEQESQWIEQNVRGTLGVLQHLGAIDGPPPALDRYLEIHDYWRVGPRAGGYLETTVGLDRQFTDVGPGELLARVVDPQTFEAIDEVRSPGRGTLFYACRPHMIRPGGWAFGVANREDGRTGWVTA
jgi:predicted deacylase